DPGLIQESFEPVSLDECVSEVVENLAPSEANRIAWDPRAEGLVQGDPVLLRAALQNGMSNALKFSEGPVRVTLAEFSDEIVVRVEDDGPGIPLEMQERVLDPFFRAED